MPVQAAKTALAATVAMPSPPRIRFSSKRGDVKRVAAHVRARNEEPHQHEERDHRVGVGGDRGRRRAAHETAGDIEAADRPDADEGQEHQRDADVHAGLDQDQAGGEAERADRDVAHRRGALVMARRRSRDRQEQELDRGGDGTDQDRGHERPDRDFDEAGGAAIVAAEVVRHEDRPDIDGDQQHQQRADRMEDGVDSGLQARPRRGSRAGSEGRSTRAGPRAACSPSAGRRSRRSKARGTRAPPESDG